MKCPYANPCVSTYLDRFSFGVLAVEHMNQPRHSSAEKLV